MKKDKFIKLKSHVMPVNPDEYVEIMYYIKGTLDVKELSDMAGNIDWTIFSGIIITHWRILNTVESFGAILMGM